jgi:hypothetical protein
VFIVFLLLSMSQNHQETVVALKVAIAAKYPTATFESISFENKPFSEQVAIVASASILIGNCSAWSYLSAKRN